MRRVGRESITVLRCEELHDARPLLLPRLGEVRREPATLAAARSVQPRLLHQPLPEAPRHRRADTTRLWSARRPDDSCDSVIGSSKRIRLGLTRLRRRFRHARTLASRAPSCAPDKANRQQPFRVAQEHRRVPALRFSAVCGGGCGYQPDQRRHGRCARHPQLAVHSHRHPIPLHLRRIDNLAEVFVTERGDAVR